MKQLLALLALVLSTTTYAQVISIDQAKALAGNVTPGDAPGFPVTITQPGSYRLTSNLTVGDINLQAIYIQSAGEVTLDLGGFVVRGGRCGQERCAISAPSAHGIQGAQIYGHARLRVVIRNGHVTEFGGAGINLDGSGNRLENVLVTRNGVHGAVLSGGQVVDSMFADNLDSGLVLLAGLARGNFMRGNGKAQLWAANGNALVTGNTMIGPLPLTSGTNAPVITNGDNLCAPTISSGARC